MMTIAQVRKERGLSQRELANRAGISFRGLQLLEQGAHNWRINTLGHVADALQLPALGLDLMVRHFMSLPPDSLQEISIRMALDGFNSWKTHLFDFVDAFRATRHKGLLAEPPITELDHRLQALCASTVESLCHQARVRVPDWCAGIPALSAPWFVSGFENLKASALIESPAWFRSRNLFVLGNFLDRA